MSCHKNNNRACGLPSVPRQTMPSMFQILSWAPQTQKNAPIAAQTDKNIKQQQIKGQFIKENKDVTKLNIQQKQQAILQNLSEVKSQTDQKVKMRPKSGTKHYKLYQYQNFKKQRSLSQVKSQPKQIIQKQVMTKQKTKEDLDSDQINKRKNRINQFQKVTRDLPNSAFVTYYGKPAFQVYGRASSNPNLLTHNVMPHKGQNHPKNVQSYYSALIKGKKSSVSYIPRRPFEEIKVSLTQQAKKNINIPMQKPDLINHIRFSSVDPNLKQSTAIPSNKIAPLKQKKLVLQTKKKSNKARKIKQEDDGLKFFDSRQDLLKIMQAKKMNASKLAYKVTQCYPYDLQNQSKMRQSTHEWQQVKQAGKQSKKSDKVSQLLKISNDYAY